MADSGMLTYKLIWLTTKNYAANFQWWLSHRIYPPRLLSPHLTPIPTIFCSLGNTSAYYQLPSFMDKLNKIIGFSRTDTNKNNQINN
ncbi:hypothetical protein LYNGBM3L_41930 [Moorena producens 3L]|uniref:Uncharacterized protein n=1 Tax=Moorena producens 3L TaxID=489825 RepID=F4XVZ4_9CYAN|nr:hypothetical protein LYNGBM3L_41930 [Moorena producens 3L]